MAKKYYYFKYTRHIDYIISLVLFLLILVILWNAFFISPVIVKKEQLIAALISSLALASAIFQFTITQINNRKKRYFELRHAFYESMLQKIEAIPQILNESMTSKEMGNVHGMVSKLMNAIQEIKVANNVYEEYLFPGLKQLNSSQKLVIILNDLLGRSDDFRREVEKLRINDDAILNSKVIAQIDWHNDMREILSSFHEVKYDYYRTIRKYF